jgi:hypothetical protein
MGSEMRGENLGKGKGRCDMHGLGRGSTFQDAEVMGMTKLEREWKKYKQTYWDSVDGVDFEDKEEMDEIYSGIKKAVKQETAGKNAKKLIDEMHDHIGLIERKSEERKALLEDFNTSYRKLVESYNGGKVGNLHAAGFSYASQVKEYLIMTSGVLTNYTNNVEPMDKKELKKTVQELKEKLSIMYHEETAGK